MKFKYLIRTFFNTRLVPVNTHDLTVNILETNIKATYPDLEELLIYVAPKGYSTETPPKPKVITPRDLGRFTNMEIDTTSLCILIPLECVDDSHLPQYVIDLIPRALELKRSTTIIVG